MPKYSSSRLDALQQKNEALQDQIRREKQKLVKEERKKDTRRKILVGAILQDESENDQELADRIHSLLKEKLTRADDRAW